MEKGKRLLAFLLLVVGMTAGAWAQSTQRLVVWQKNGEKVYFDLAEEPETTFEGTKLVIKTSSTTVYYQIENVLRYTFEGAMTAIGNPKLRPGEIIFRQGTDKMAFDGLPDGARIDVYTLDGKKVKTQNAHGGKQTLVSLAGYPVGTYIVKVGDATYKFLKR